MLRLCYLTFFALLPLVIHAQEPVSLFNGKDLEGWTFDVIDPEVKPTEIWSVVDGVLICKGRPPGVIRTEKDYKNYELNIEWRWAPGKKAGNSGVLVHASTPRDRFIWPKSLEVQLGTGNAGDFWMIGESVTVENTSPQGRRLMKRQNSTEKPVGEWNAMRIVCKENTITVWVNGVLMNEGKDLSTTGGAICLQSEGAEIHFRKVELKALE